MQESLKEILENTIYSINIFGDNSRFKYMEGGFGDSNYNFECILVEIRPGQMDRPLFRKSYVIVDHKEKTEFKEDLVRAQFLRELITYAVGASRHRLNKINEA